MKLSREVILQIQQKLHNLKMKFPIGIRSIDDKTVEEIKRLEAKLLNASVVSN